MAHYDDLSSCDYFGPCERRLVAIGWLAEGRAYSRGEATPEFFSALIRLLVKPWQPVAAAGMERCFLCRFTGGPRTMQHEEMSVQVGSANLFVPAERAVFVAPSMVAHYIDAHGYAPPDEFQQAVLKCPAMRSMAYLKAIAQHGIQRIGDTA